MEFIESVNLVSMGLIVAVIIAVSEVLKGLGVNVKWIPLCNLILGVAVCVVFTDFNLSLRVFNGVIVGLMASGVFSAQKNVRQGINGKDMNLSK